MRPYRYLSTNDLRRLRMCMIKESLDQHMSILEGTLNPDSPAHRGFAQRYSQVMREFQRRQNQNFIFEFIDRILFRRG